MTYENVCENATVIKRALVDFGWCYLKYHTDDDYDISDACGCYNDLCEDCGCCRMLYEVCDKIGLDATETEVIAGTVQLTNEDYPMIYQHIFGCLRRLTDRKLYDDLCDIAEELSVPCSCCHEHS